jgi:hypothetical protein
VASYRLYCLDQTGRISLADWIEATDDTDAIRQAHQLRRDARKCEVWEDRRLVAHLDSNDLREKSAT